MKDPAYDACPDDFEPDDEPTADDCARDFGELLECDTILKWVDRALGAK